MIALNINFRFVGPILIKINMKLHNFEAKILAAIEAWLLCMNINDIDLIKNKTIHTVVATHPSKN
jgi:hypothetical protein